MIEPRPTYAAAGVDLEAAESAVERIKPHVARTARPGVVDELGGFAGLFALDPKRYKQPLLVAATDGVGTKLEVARALGRHDTVGVDLVAMVVDDLVTVGAEPLFFLDYLAVGRLEPAAVEQLVAGIADGCQEAGCALLGGEMAEHPGIMAADRYDVAGFGVGAVDRRRRLGPHRVRPADAVVALASTGLHANGYSLARQIVAGVDLAGDHGLVVQSLGEALLRPTRIYARDCLALAAGVEVHALAHVTGGGIPGNLSRALPHGLGAVIDTKTFEPPAIFGWLAGRGRVDAAEMWRVFNMGAGMLAVVPDGEAAVAFLRGRGIDAWTCGVVDQRPGIRLAGL